MKKRIVILGGGFAGVYTARYLEKLFKKERDRYEIVLVNRENYFTFQPMLAEVVGGSLGTLDSVSALYSLLKNTSIYVREISEIDIKQKTITLSPNFNHTDLLLSYDILVLALGNVTDFRHSPGGLHEHALGFKNLADAFKLRNRIIDIVETAANEPDPIIRKQLLTFVVGGGGFSGIEIVAEINDLVRRLIKGRKQIAKEEVRVILVHSKERLAHKELSPALGTYAAKILQNRGVEILFNTQLISATPSEAILNTGFSIKTSTVISTVPPSANPLIEGLPLIKIKDRIATDDTMQVLNRTDIWALGDCAAIPSKTPMQYCPATAQFAVREAKCAAYNIWASLHQKSPKAFTFKGYGMLISLGHRKAAAELFGGIKISGFIAWVFWRFIYWLKLPKIHRKIRVWISWLLDMIIPQESVQLKTEFHTGIAHLFYTKGETIFHKGDVGNFLYIIKSGKVEVLESSDGKEKQIAVLKEGDFFGEMALLNEKRRLATVRSLEDCEVLALRKSDFQILITQFGALKEQFEKVEKERLKEAQKAILPPLDENTGS
ncbi:MAG: FAD-dependent oxidoreductase [Verrucomicrobia bacterium]|nr:FAD-dependent oxidoreductase [Verrucomicrobiota bacterium]